MSTSEVMKEELGKYTKKEVVVTPFGVDTSSFAAKPVDGKDTSLIHVGSIKPMEEKYGIKNIIDAAELLIKKAEQPYRFYLIGEGSELDLYRHLILEKGLARDFVLTGRIPFAEVNHYHQLLDIFLNVSINDSESFGVATVEAMACETPVIVTDVGGLMEVVERGTFGTVVAKNSATELAQAIEHIATNKAHYKTKALAARNHVLAKYDWNNNLNHMIEQYNLLIAKKLNKKK